MKLKLFGIIMLALIVVLYVLFFKPSPVVRVNVNKLQAGSTQTSALVFEAPAEVGGVGRKFTVKVALDTKGYSVNAVQSYVEFDPDVLEVLRTDTSESFCKFYPENNYDNQKGIIKLACGTPYPGFSGTSSVLSVEFISKAIQTTELKLTKDSMVLANDGKGTNLLSEFNTASIQIKAGL